LLTLPGNVSWSRPTGSPPPVYRAGGDGDDPGGRLASAGERDDTLAWTVQVSELLSPKVMAGSGGPMSSFASVARIDRSDEPADTNGLADSRRGGFDVTRSRAAELPKTKRTSGASKEPVGPFHSLVAQFGRPSGVLGKLAGAIMARLDQDDRWIVELLDVHPRDRVLEVGCGPGVALALLAERAFQGSVAGVDPSDVMLRQAARRNRAAIRAGRVELRRADAATLPYPTGHFTKACSIHSLYYWPSLEDGLRELHRVLAPGGLLVLASRMRRPDGSRFDHPTFGYTEPQADRLIAILGRTGFGDLAVREWEQVGRFGGQLLRAFVARRQRPAPEAWRGGGQGLHTG
jgi:SAM-dependent methyltransferase